MALDLATAATAARSALERGRDRVHVPRLPPRVHHERLLLQGCHRFLPTLIAMDGFRVTEIAVRNHPRRSGRSHYGVWNRLFRSSADLLAVRWMKNRAVRYEIADAINLPRAARQLAAGRGKGAQSSRSWPSGSAK